MSIIWVLLFETTRGGVEVDKVGDSFEGARERSDIGEWRVLILGLSFYVEMAGSAGVSDDMRRLVLGRTRVPWVPRCYLPRGNLAT